jgi:periplasmic divalent cation tolerance protein
MRSAHIGVFSTSSLRLCVSVAKPVWTKMTDKIMVLVVCGSANEARRIARTLVEGRLAACGNILEAPVRSIYRWKGKVESARECLLIVKSSRKRFGKLKNTVKRLHSYDVPEIIALPIAAGSADYLRWIDECVSRDPARK